MIVPRYWAEARVHKPRDRERGQITVRRFGWSDATQAEADHMARLRAEAALAGLVAGRKGPRREPKVAYNGAEGVPIREEILASHGDVVITRNAYGAACLNTPDVLFADIDFSTAPGCRSVLAHWALLTLALAGLVVIYRPGALLFPALVAGMILAYPASVATHRVLSALQGGPEKAAVSRLRALARRLPGSRFRLYRSPAGLRVLALHRLFDPTSPEVAEIFRDLRADPLYAQMCKNQRCFRARVSPKPWRIGIDRHLRPRPGTWPIKPEHLPMRRAWVEAYERAASGFASCRFVEDMGDGALDAKAERVCALHDRLSRAHDGVSIA